MDNNASGRWPLKRIVGWAALAAVGCLAAMMSIVVLMCRMLHPHDAEAHRQLVALMRTVERDTASRYFGIVGKDPYARLAVGGEGWHGDRLDIAIATPVECGGKNWVLRLEYENDALRSARIRTAGAKDVHPSDAPADKIFPN